MKPGMVESIVRDCVHRIATGAFRAGEKLPTLRAAEDLWSVHQLTVLKAYRRLVSMGLVRSGSGSPACRS